MKRLVIVFGLCLFFLFGCSTSSWFRSIIYNSNNAFIEENFNNTTRLPYNIAIIINDSFKAESVSSLSRI